jgi:dipeptidyl aminopeptidase/acylaminoacyl peptidase
MFPRKLLAALLALLTGAATAAAADTGTRGAFTPLDLVSLQRLSDPQASPDGRYVAYVLRSTDLAANKGHTNLYLLDLAHRELPPRQLTTSAANDFNPRWSQDGRSLYFLSNRSGSAQVWRLPLDGGESAQVTRLALDVAALKVSPDGQRLLLAMDVFPDCADLRCTATRLEEMARRKNTGRVFDQLFIRHWDRWEDGTQSHLFTLRLTPDGQSEAPIDISGQVRGNVPSRPQGGDEEFAFSPDGSHVVFSARLATHGEPWSTNFDLYEVAADGSGTARNLTAANLAWDTQPVYLADGSLAYLAMDRPGFEADRFKVMLRDARSGAAHVLTQHWDCSVIHLAASFDGKSLLASTDDHGQVSLYSIDAHSGTATRLTDQGQVTGYTTTRYGIVAALASLDAPPDLFLVGPQPQRLTAVNKALLDARFTVDARQFTFKGANDEPVSGYVVKPYGYQPGRKYPVAFVIHGGPQSAFGNAWSYRWNPKTFAGAGYAVVFIDFHGTPGYGQKFTDSISNDWGGKPLVDLQKGLKAALAANDFLDGGRACALGASYGGFMINWIAGNWPDGFRCLVNHDGIFDARSMYYDTEELWFDEWEHGGTYFENAASFEKFNPSAHVLQWRTPMLVIQGGQDFRVPEGQGIGTFTALQRLGIKSRLLYFPDENHWVLKPANSLQWYQTVLGWLQENLATP